MRGPRNLFLLLAHEDGVALEEIGRENCLLPQNHVKFSRFGPALFSPGALDRKIVFESSVEGDVAVWGAPAR